MAGKETTKSGNKAIIFMNTHIEGRLKIVKEVTSLKKKNCPIGVNWEKFGWRENANCTIFLTTRLLYQYLVKTL